MNTNDSNNNGNGAHYGMMPFAPPPRHPSEYTQLIPGPPMNSYPQSMISGNYGSSCESNFKWHQIAVIRVEQPQSKSQCFIPSPNPDVLCSQ